MFYAQRAIYMDAKTAHLRHASGRRVAQMERQSRALPIAFLTTQLCDDWRLYHLYVRKISLLKMHYGWKQICSAARAGWL